MQVVDQLVARAHVVDGVLRREQLAPIDHRLELVDRIGAAPAREHLALDVLRRIADAQPHQEAVELRLRQRVGAVELLGVLRREHEERLVEHARLAVDRHAPLAHRLEQRALRLGRRAVDLVGEQHVGEDRARRKVNCPVACEYTLPPSTSAGIRSDVNCMRRNSSPTLAASARASVVLPTPGTSSISRWPRASSAATASSTTSRLPSSTRSTLPRIRCAVVTAVAAGLIGLVARLGARADSIGQRIYHASRRALRRALAEARGKLHRECRACIGLTREPHLPTVCSDQGSRKRRAEPEPRYALAGRGVRRAQSLEETLVIRLPDAQARVAHLDPHAKAGCARRARARPTA